MIKVLYDHQAFSLQEYGGISRYFSELIKNFSYSNEIKPELSVLYSNNNYLSDFVKVESFFPNFRFKGRNLLLEFINRVGTKNKLNNYRDYRLFHPTYYNPYFLKKIKNTPFILTIHDMTHEHYPDSFSKLDNTLENKKIVASEAERIIAISEFTKKDITKFYKIPESRIDVVYHASSISLIDARPQSIDLPDQFILYVGKRNTYKNFPFFLKAIKRILFEKTNLYLVCAGGGKFNKSEINLMYNLNIKDKIVQIPVDDNSLAYLYSKAGTFIFPSLFEGFGIPVLEAFSCGCPAVLSNNTVLPEIGNTAALYFDPNDEESLITALFKVLNDKELRVDLQRKGYERASQFSWKKTADETFKVYKKALESN